MVGSSAFVVTIVNKVAPSQVDFEEHAFSPGEHILPLLKARVGGETKLVSASSAFGAKSGKYVCAALPRTEITPPPHTQPTCRRNPSGALCRSLCAARKRDLLLLKRSARQALHGGAVRVAARRRRWPRLVGHHHQCKVHMQTLVIDELGFNQEKYTFTLILLTKIVMCSKYL